MIGSIQLKWRVRIRNFWWRILCLYRLRFIRVRLHLTQLSRIRRSLTFVIQRFSNLSKLLKIVVLSQIKTSRPAFAPVKGLKWAPTNLCTASNLSWETLFWMTQRSKNNSTWIFRILTKFKTRQFRSITSLTRYRQCGIVLTRLRMGSKIIPCRTLRMSMQTNARGAPYSLESLLCLTTLTILLTRTPRSKLIWRLLQYITRTSSITILLVGTSFILLVWDPMIKPLTREILRFSKSLTVLSKNSTVSRTSRTKNPSLT